MENQQYLNCPDCGSKIPFDPYALVKGASFMCPRCPSISIGLAPGSREIVENTLNKFEMMKKKAGEMSREQSSS